jgi:hypothetical protein
VLLIISQGIDRTQCARLVFRDTQVVTGQVDALLEAQRAAELLVEDWNPILG